MRRIRLALAALLLALGLGGVAACSSATTYPTPATWTVSYAGADYCGYIYDPHEVDMYGTPLTCRRAMFPSPVAVVVPGTLQWALLGYLEEYDGFYHSGYWYDQYYAPLGARYHVTVIQRTTFLSNAHTFESKYATQIRNQSAKAKLAGREDRQLPVPDLQRQREEQAADQQPHQHQRRLHRGRRHHEHAGQPHPNHNDPADRYQRHHRQVGHHGAAAVTDLLTRTACGLYVLDGGNPREWPNVTWTTRVADMPGEQEELDALALIAKELMGQVGQNTASGQYVAPLDVAFACLHAGAVDRVEHPGLDFADPEVPDDALDRDLALQPVPWTVCGVLESSWRTVRYEATAGTPLVAYFYAWQWAGEQHGEHMLLAAVHEGHHDAVEVFGYADPWARDGEAMGTKAAEQWGVRRG